MALDDPAPIPGSDPSGDDPFAIDFAAIVAEHNASSSKEGRAGRPRRSARRERESTSEPIAETSPSTSVADLERPAADGAKVAAPTSRWWRVGYPVAIGASLLALVLLVWFALGTILDSTDGQLRHRVDDPAAPGYEAALDKTPTALLLLTSPEKTLDSMVLVSLMSDSSAGVIVMPSGLVLTSSYGEDTAASWYSRGGAGSVALGVSTMLQLGFNDTIEVPSSQWASLLAPYGDLTVSNPDPVRDASDKQVFAKGTVTLSPSQVATYLSSKGPKDSELLRVNRVESFMKAFLAKVQSAPGSFPLPTASGLGYFVVDAARGQVAVADLPVASATTPAGQSQRYAVQKDAAQSTMAAMVPFPDGAGMRARFRVLDGTGRLDNGLSAAVVLAAAGGQIDVIGNANRFDVETTTIYYYDGTSEEVAAHFRDAIGLGDIQRNNASATSADIVVVLGADYADRGGAVGMASSSTSTTVTR